MNDLISVIVPIYKVEKYLNKCVDSLINQTYRNLEIILVDDGSPDNCPIICDDYANKDDRVKVIHKSNGGLSDARNAGMKVATGKYISFIDSDDYISLDFMETMLNTMILKEADIVECDIVKFYDHSKTIEINDNLNIRTFDAIEGMSSLILEKEFHQYVWNKLYKTEIIRNMFFNVGKTNEDDFWTYKIFGEARRVSKINKSMYYYFQRNDSIMGKNYNIKRLDELEAKLERQKYIENYFPQLTVTSKINFSFSCLYACQCSLIYLDAGKDDAIETISSYYKFAKLNNVELKDIDVKSKLWLKLANFNLVLCCRIRNFLEIGM